MKEETAFKFIIVIFIAFISFLLGFSYSRKKATLPFEPGIEIHRDTVYLRDTVYPPIPVPDTILLVRFDTVAVIDTFTVVVPIERIEYLTDDYRATIEGYKPALTGIEIYPQVRIIRSEVVRYKYPRFAVTAGVGGGLGGMGDRCRFDPYIGINIGYVLWHSK